MMLIISSLISTLLNVGYKKPMLFIINELKLPFELYLIWVGFISCIFAFIVYNIKNNNLNSKLTFLIYLCIFIISIIFTYIINIFLGSLCSDIIFSLLFFSSISWNDIFNFYVINFKHKLYLGLDEEELYNSNIKLIERNFMEATPSEKPQSSVSNNELSQGSTSQPITDSHSKTNLDYSRKLLASIEQALSKHKVQAVLFRYELDEFKGSSSSSISETDLRILPEKDIRELFIKENNSIEKGNLMYSIYKERLELKSQYEAGKMLRTKAHIVKENVHLISEDSKSKFSAGYVGERKTY